MDFINPLPYKYEYKIRIENDLFLFELLFLIPIKFIPTTKWELTNSECNVATCFQLLRITRET